MSEKVTKNKIPNVMFSIMITFNYQAGTFWGNWENDWPTFQHNSEGTCRYLMKWFVLKFRHLYIYMYFSQGQDWKNRFRHYAFLCRSTGETGYDGPLYDRFLHMTDCMVGPSPMHTKYSSYVYDGFCIWRTNFPGPIESVISKFTCICFTLSKLT